MKWPRGKWNGKRIVGISFKIKIDVTRWRWMPMRVKYVGGLHWLCVYTWTEWEYEDRFMKYIEKLLSK